MTSIEHYSEQFAPLLGVENLQHFFTLRIPGVPLLEDKMTMVKSLENVHAQIALRHGVDFDSIVRCEQTHGDRSVIVETSQSGMIPDVDGLITRQPGLPIGIHVADCCPVFIYERKTPSIALVHSGKRGTLSNITGKTIRMMLDEFSVEPADLRVLLGPCIRKGNYEMDIPGMIREQCEQIGPVKLYDTGLETASDLSRYYSYRMEKGKTGRLFAVMMLKRI